MSSLNDYDSQVKTASFHMLWASLSFALMAAFSHLAGERCDWQLVVVARASVAFLFSAVIAKAAGVKLIFRGPAMLWVRSLAGSVGMLGNFYALSKLPVSDTLTLMNTSPIWVALLLWLIFKQKPTAGIIAAILTSVVGVALIQQPHFQHGKLACLMALCGAFCTSVAMLGLNRLGHLDPRAIVVHFSGVASVATLLFIALTSRKDYFPQLKTPSIWVLLAMVGIAGVGGQIGMTLAFAKGNASRISVIALSQILFGLVFDIALWGRTINVVSIIGILLVSLPAAWLLLSRTPEQSHDLVEVEMED